jgi:hypothetical protein
MRKGETKAIDYAWSTILLNQGQVHHSCAVETGRPPESASGCHLFVERSCQ